MFRVMCFLQSLLVALRFAGVSHKVLDPVAQRLPFAKYLS